MNRKGWLGHRIEAARKEMESWPEWMKEAATFEGSKRNEEMPQRRQPISEEKPSKNLDV